MSCFCAVIDIVRCCSTSHTTSPVSSADKAVLTAEAPRIARAEHRVIAAAPLGDVVEQRRDNQNLRPREVGDQARAQRILVRVLRLHEAAQVADHHQDVLVDGVHVEQVVLHLADDATEDRQVAAEDAVLVHASQLVRDAARLAQDLDETRAVDRIAAKRGVDAVAIAPERAQQRRRHALELRMPLQRQKAVEDRRRALDEQRVVLHVEQFVDRLEVGVDGRAP